jgi:hypothetical protein
MEWFKSFIRKQNVSVSEADISSSMDDMDSLLSHDDTFNYQEHKSIPFANDKTGKQLQRMFDSFQEELSRLKKKFENPFLDVPYSQLNQVCIKYEI